MREAVYAIVFTVFALYALSAVSMMLFTVGWAIARSFA